ncbi:MAG: hypothetical protein ABI295_01845 [Xanthomarina sp.]
MKEWLKYRYNRLFLGVLFLLIVLNVFASLSENDVLIQITKPLFIPVFIMFYYLKNRYVHILFIVFFILSFIGDSSSVFLTNNTLIKLSGFMYLLSYLALTAYMVSKIKRIRFGKVVAAYFLVVICINSYFLFELYGIVKSQILDITEVNLFIAKSISIMILAFVSFFIYLNSDTKQAILFLTTTLCFVFSEVMHYINNYYIYNWSFVVFNQTLYVIGLFFLFNYITGENRSRKRQLVLEKRSTEIISSKSSYTLIRQ